MTRHNPWRSAMVLVLGAIIASALGATAAGEQSSSPKGANQQPTAKPPAKQPTTRPSEQQLQEDLRQLVELRDKLERERQERESQATQPATPQAGDVVTPPGVEPVERGAERPSLEELKRRARTSTQAAVSEEEDEDDFVGPPYPPASPPSVRAIVNNGAAQATQLEAGEPEEAARPERREPPVSRATDDLEWFNFDGMPTEDVVRHFAERIGKPLLADVTGDLIVGGEITYKTQRKFTKEEAINELNLILHLMGYRFVEMEQYVNVIPLNEMHMYVPLQSVYPSRAAFEQAPLQAADYVAVYVQIKDRPAADIQRMFETMVPDYMTIVALEETNQLKLVGLVRDIQRVLGLMDRVPLEAGDPYVTRIFKIETSAREIERMVREILGVGTAAATQLRIDPRTRRPVPVPTAAADSAVRMTADDRTNSIIVRATPEKLAEIDDLIKQIDIKPPDIEFHTQVYEIKNANVSDVADLLNTIFSQEQGQTVPAWQQLRQMQQMRAAAAARTRQPGRPGQPATPATPQPIVAVPEELLGEGLFERMKKTIRIAADERTNSLVVYANKDGHQRVQELLSEIDRAQPSNLQTIELKHVDAAVIFPTLNQIVQNLAAASRRGRAPSIVLDEANNLLHVLAEREQMQQIQEVVERLDVVMPEGTRHVVELVNLAPSRVAAMIQPLLTGERASPVRQPRLPGRPGMPGAVSATLGGAGDVQIIPLDEAQLLIVVCPDEDWAKVEETIRLWDERAVSSTPQLQTFEIQHGSPQVVADALNAMYRGQYNHPALGRSQVLIQAEGSAVLVYAVRPAVEEIASLIEALDREDASRYEILPLSHADASQVAQEAVQLFSAGRRMGPGGAAGGVVIQAEPVTNSLIVRADPVTLDKIRDFAQRRDEAVRAQVPEQRFFTLRHAEAREVAAAVQTIYAGGARQRGVPAGTQVKAVATGTQVIVEAPKDKMVEIEAFVAQLDDPKGNEIIIRTIKLPGADVAQIASKLSNAFREKKNLIARFDADPQAETILLTCSRDALEQAEKLIAEYAEAQKGQAPKIEFFQMTYAQATDAANWLREQLMTYMTPQLGRNVASLIKVTADSRTNRVVINGPEVAVQYGKLLLQQFDVEVSQPPVTVVQNELRKLPGVDVQSLAHHLTVTFRNQPRRPDGLSATFTGDPATETLIVSAPKDMYEEINGLIGRYQEEAKAVEPEQKFIDVQNADANYIAAQVTNLLNVQLSRTRGADVARRVNIAVDSRLNRLIINAPKFVIPMAEALVAELDQVATAEGMIRTIALENADAGTVVGILNNVLRERIRQKRTLSLSAEPMTNSIIVSGDKEDFQEIEKWARELDEQAVAARGEMRIVDVLNANPWEVVQILSNKYAPKGYGRRSMLGQEISFQVAAGRSVVVQAPAEKMPEIEELIAQLDLVGVKKIEVRTYELPGIGDQLGALAGHVQNAVNSKITGREQRISVSTYPPADALIVTALPEQFAEVEAMVEQFKPLVLKEKAVSRFIELKHVDAAAYAGTIQNMLAVRVKSDSRRGSRDLQNVQITADPRTNRLICYVPEKIVADLEEVVAQLDVPGSDDVPVTIELKYADPWQVVQMINAMYAGLPGARQREVQALVSNAMVVVRAPQKRLEEIRALVAEVDAPDSTALQIQTYQLKLLNAREVAAQVQLYLRSIGTQQRRGQMQPGAFAEPTTNTLVVIAPQQQLPFIQALVTKLESSDRPESEARTYVLRNARADQIAPNVDAMLKAKIREREGDVRVTTIQTAVFSDPISNRLFVYAPQAYHELAAKLIAMVDEEVETTDIVHIITLEKADAQEMARSLQQMIEGNRRGSGTPGARSGTATVRVAADVGSNSILLAGMPKDVAEVESWIEELEEKSEVIPELQVFRLQNANAVNLADTLTSILGIGARAGRGAGTQAVTITPDEYYNRLLVTASKRKMREIEGFIELLDSAPELDPDNPLADWSGRQLYFVDVYRGDAFDIAWEVRDLLPDPKQGGPVVEADWFGEYIKVKCRPSEFDQILALIRELEKRARVEKKVVTRKLRGDPGAVLAYLRERMPEEQLEVQFVEEERPRTIVETLWGDDEEPEAVRQRREREKQRRSEREGSAVPTGGGVRPFRLGLPVTAALLDDVEAEIFDQPPAVPRGRPAAPAAEPERPDAERPVSSPVAATKAPPAADRDEAARQRDKTSVLVRPDGTLLIYGPRSDVKEVEDILDLLEEDLAVGEVIRIFHFKYGDVSAAAEVINIMFNERQIILPQPQPQQRGRPGERGEEGREQQGMLEQLRGMIGGREATRRDRRVSGQRVRIATDPGHNYLIIKCDESDLPEIRQLLRELDIPPGEVELKVFQLRNLDAAETAENIKDVLGVSKVQQRRTGTSPRQTPGRPGTPQAQLMEMLQQQLVSVPGVEGGAKVERVEIVANAVTNSLMVSAPPEVMKIIENIIVELEELEGFDVVGIYHYRLERAKVDEILPLLEQIFSAAGVGGARRGPRVSRAAPGTLGPVTISGDPRVNTIIYTCEAKDREIVEGQIRMLDIEGAIAEAETYVCKFGDAQAIADVVNAIFGSAVGPRGGARPGAAPVGGPEVRIVAEPVTNTIIVWGPPDKRDAIFAKIEELDLRGRRDIREIPVIYADPEKIADTLLQMFGGSGAAAAGPRGRGARPAATGAGGIMIIGDKNARKLLVRAPDEVFRQIETVVATLDQPNEQMQIRRYALQYADADVVVESLRGALQEYVAMLGVGPRGGDMPFDPFTVVPDPRTNSIVVVGSQQTFAFVENVLAMVDVETPAEQRKDFRVFVLENADAEAVAQAINDFAAGGGAGATGARRTPGARRGATPSGASGLARTLDVYATADAASNAVLVFGRPEHIDLVEDAIIGQIEDKIRNQFVIETIPVRNVRPTEIVSFIYQFVGQPMGEARTAAGPGRGTRRAESTGPQIIPNDAAGNLVVRGTPGDVARVRELVEKFDNPDLIVQKIKVVKIPLGQDVVRLASEVERLVNQIEEDDAARTGRQRSRISVAPDEYTNTLIIGGEQSLFGMAISIIDQLSEIRRDNVVTRVIQLTNLSAEDAQRMIQDLQRRGGTGTRGGAQPRTPTRTPGGTRRPGGRGDASWPRWREVPPVPGATPTLAGLRPYVSAALLAPGVAVALADEWLDEGQPPTGRTGAGDQEPATQPERPRGRRPAREAAPAQPGEQAARESEPTAALPRQAQPAELEDVTELLPVELAAGLTGITGELRGDVVVSAIDSKRVIITGDESDIEFIEQILAMMERTAAPALVEVFTLRNAKATVLAPIIEKAVDAQIRVTTPTPGPQDRFSINAEGRSNSLIVSASETVMAQIGELIEKLDVEKVDGGIDFRSVPLRHVRAADAVAMLRPTVEKLNKMREVPTESQASLEALDRSNSVLVIGTPKDVEDIQRLIRTIDVEITGEDEQASYVYADAILIQLQNGQAEDVAKVLMDMIQEQQKRAREARSARDRAAEPYVTKIRLRTADGRELPELDLERPIGIIPEKGTNSLIVFSTKKNNEALTEYVREFDTLPIGADTELRAIALRHASAAEVATILDKVFDEGKKALARPSEGDAAPGKGVLPPVPPSLTGKGLPYNLVVQHDVRSNTIVIIGRQDAVMLAAGLVAQLDKSSLELAGRPYLIELKNMNAAQLAEKLDDLLEKRARAWGVDKNEARDSAVITPDERGNKLVVFATPEVFEMIEDLAMELDAAEPYRVVDVRYRRLACADAQKLRGLLEELFDRKQQAEKEQSREMRDTLSVLADTRSNSLLLVGTRDYLAEANGLIDKLDQQFDPTVVFVVRPVRLNSAANISTLLQDMVDKALKAQDSKLQGTPIHIAADPLSDSLLMAAAAEDMVMLERWVEILDRPSEVGRMTAIVPLRSASAENVAKAAQDIFRSTGAKEIDVTVTYDASTNSVVAFGPPALLKDIQAFVRQLDLTEGQAGSMIRIFKLLQADAEDAGELLMNILEGRGGAVGGGTARGTGGRQEVEKQVMLWFQREHPELGVETLRAMRKDVVVISDLRTNSLVVTAPPESMALMESLIARIDVPPDAARVRVFPLRNADAEQMVRMLQELFERRAATGGRRGTAQESQRELTVEGLTGLGGRQEVSFTTDTRTNSVIAAGTPGYLDLVEQIILELDSKPIDERKTFVYRPRNNVAQNLATALRDFSQQEQQLLQELGAEISLARRQEREIIAIPHEESNRIVLSYSPRFESSVMEVVRELDQPPPQVSIEVLIIEVSMDTSLELGVEFAFQDLQYTKAGPTDTTTFDFVGGTDVGAAGAGLGGFTFTITGRDFNFLLRTLQSEGSLNVLSRPHIVAMDNQEAKIQITDSVPYVTGTQTTAAGQISTTVGRSDVGIELEVKPQINPDGFVRLEIMQKVSDQTGSNVPVGPGLVAPVFFERVAETVVTVQDGETVVLGGLIQSRDREQEQKIPLLGDLPLLGPLFRYTNQQKSRAELLLVLTPRVIRTVDDYREVSLRERDQTGLIPDQVKMNPLLRGLQMRPDELAPLDGDELFGPFEELPTDQIGPPQPGAEPYGPTRPAGPPNRREAGVTDPDSYHVPVGLLGRRR